MTVRDGEEITFTSVILLSALKVAVRLADVMAYENPGKTELSAPDAASVNVKPWSFLLAKNQRTPILRSSLRETSAMVASITTWLGMTSSSPMTRIRRRYSAGVASMRSAFLARSAAIFTRRVPSLSSSVTVATVIDCLPGPGPCEGRASALREPAPPRSRGPGAFHSTTASFSDGVTLDVSFPSPSPEKSACSAFTRSWARRFCTA
jgi:hypothetical protein